MNDNNWCKIVWAAVERHNKSDFNGLDIFFKKLMI